jgi:hypothetical protein
MKDLENSRAQEKKKENQQILLMSKLMEQHRERFDYADTAQWMLDEKFEVDLIYIQEKVFEWLKSAKNENQKKVLNEMILVCFRINSYTENLRTLSKVSVAKYVVAEKRINSLSSELRLLGYDKDSEIEKLKKELSNAKKEIEFLSKD